MKLIEEIKEIAQELHCKTPNALAARILLIKEVRRIADVLERIDNGELNTQGKISKVKETKE